MVFSILGSFFKIFLMIIHIIITQKAYTEAIKITLKG